MGYEIEYAIIIYVCLCISGFKVVSEWKAKKIFHNIKRISFLTAEIINDIVAFKFIFQILYLYCFHNDKTYL